MHTVDTTGTMRMVRVMDIITVAMAAAAVAAAVNRRS